MLYRAVELFLLHHHKYDTTTTHHTPSTFVYFEVAGGSGRQVARQVGSVVAGRCREVGLRLRATPSFSRITLIAAPPFSFSPAFRQMITFFWPR